MRSKLFVSGAVAAVIAAALAMAPAGQAASVGSCTLAELNGNTCQGPDANPAANACSISVWVGSAKCVLRVPGGVVQNLNVGWHTTADGSNPVKFAWFVRDAQDNVLVQDSGSDGGPACLGIFVCTPVSLYRDNGFSNSSITISPTDPTPRVVCHIKGTHSILGAVDPEAQNTFTCSVN
jgi:hypothetical protein